MLGVLVLASKVPAVANKVVVCMNTVSELAPCFQVEPATDPSRAPVTVTWAVLMLVTVMAPVMVAVEPKVMLLFPPMFWLLVLKVTVPVPKDTVPALLLVKPFLKTARK